MAGVRELRHPSTGELLDEALVLRFDGPASATGENIVEFQCHGGRAVVDAVLAALSEVAGVREARPGEFTRRAFENGRIDLTEAEGLADLIDAETESQRKAAMALAEGGLRKQIAAWQDRLLALSAMAERAIDYDEDDVGVDAELKRDCANLGAELRQWLERPRIEPLKDGVRIVIAGPPNVGKSSLINALAGEERVIVTDVPGTTRDHIEVPLSLNGVPVLLTDTAGVRETEDRIEAIGVQRAEQLMETADVLVWLGDPEIAPAHPRLVQVHSKADMAGRAEAPEGWQAVSAMTGAGLPELLQTMEAAARAVLPGEDAIALNRRQATLIAEAESRIGAAVNLNESRMIRRVHRFAKPNQHVGEFRQFARAIDADSFEELA
jgi:tRNA modification GTPase